MIDLLEHMPQPPRWFRTLEAILPDGWEFSAQHGHLDGYMVFDVTVRVEVPGHGYLVYRLPQPTAEEQFAAGGYEFWEWRAFSPLLQLVVAYKAAQRGGYA